ncbi:MAG: hydroxylamine reductase [Chloroflexota bacterium]
MNMFCFQCEEALAPACTRAGVCGKTPEVACLQDLLVWQLKGLAFYGVRARTLGIVDAEADRFVAEALFSTITNVNFDASCFVGLVRRAVTLRDRLAARLRTAGALPDALPEMATWQPGEMESEALAKQGALVGLMSAIGGDEDLRSLRELLLYGLKGLAAYLDHAYLLDYQDEALLAFLQEGLVSVAKPDATADELVAMVSQCGAMGVQAMALLDKANTSTYGHPEPTQVQLGVRPGPAILVSGHDLRDLADLLEQTNGKGINVYTHGEMLPAHAYPELKKYPHLVGNYGGAWWQQKDEFESFGGAILMTTNCLVRPDKSYQARLFTTGLVGWPGVQHIPDRPAGGRKDFTPVIEAALAAAAPRPLEEGTLTVGLAHHAALSVADKIVEAVKSGAIKRFVVMAGCDGRQKERTYYTELAQRLPKDMVILTAGCAKYRYNKLPLGEIAGFPRVIDAGQCNDSYSLVVIAQKLAEVFGVEDINDLPVSYDIAWYEQKAVVVLLALLYLGVKHIRLGPALPAFISPGVLKVLVEKFDIKPNATVEEDLAAIVAGN